MNTTGNKNDDIWKALADGTRRDILDALADRPLQTGEVVSQFKHLCRTNVMKHIDILVRANLIVIRREGRVRWNYLNPLPIQTVCDRWVSHHVKQMASSLGRLKELVENREQNETSPNTTQNKSTRSKP